MNWEVVRLPDDPQLAVWAWRSPPGAPLSIAVQIPAAMLQAAAGRLNVRRLLPALQVEARSLLAIGVQGLVHPVLQGTSPLLDQPLAALPGMDLQVCLYSGPATEHGSPPLTAGVMPAVMPGLMPAPIPFPGTAAAAAVGPFMHAMPVLSSAAAMAPGGAAHVAESGPAAASVAGGAALRAPTAAGPAPSGGSGGVDPATHARYNAIETDWLAILQVEAQLGGLRKQLAALQGKLQSLNRDLSTDEARASDSQDKRDWQDARRWLRDSAAQVSRVLRAYDIGIISSAGNRNRFLDVFSQFVEPRRPLEGLASWQQQFEAHRKTAQSLLNEMTSVLGSAARDGEQRAQQLLSRIATKVRTARTKR
jgi:hypothetical protein